MEPVVVFLALFGTVFGIAYVYLTTRNKERLALIEKEMDASLFVSKGPKFSIAKFILNLALLFVGIGIGIFLGNYLAGVMGFRYERILNQQVMIPSMVFIFGGLGLVTGFFITRKLEKGEG